MRKFIYPILLISLFFNFHLSAQITADELIQGTVRVESPMVASIYYTAIENIPHLANASNVITLNISITVDRKGRDVSQAPSVTYSTFDIFAPLGITPIAYLPYIEGDRFVYTFVVSGDVNPVVWNKDEEKHVFDLVFSEPVFTNNNYPRLQDDQTGGTGAQSYFYVEFNGIDVTNYPDKFYGGTEGSTPHDYVESLSPLPVQLTTFMAEKFNANSSRLNWTTSSEINSDYFLIERSTDAKNWTALTKVPAAGNSYTERGYEYYDRNITLNRSADNIFYYRLKMTDLDGKYQYSDVRGVNFGRQVAIDNISLYPNPAAHMINVDVSALDSDAGVIRLNVFDMSGQMVLSKEVIGTGIELVDVTHFANGTYQVILTQGDKTYKERFIKID
ncbi:MAG: T9SS type A sorting domain-containing protein [Saprospiraceae bacterium]|nr:MAG: peptidase S8 and S53 subtilisin kexin sedolisin [Bacteroidetes bacterium OLB9]MCO6463906.1 T9SS type A sorting domain-containing protein [Saprospiraceae bacterium]MCZ2338058.1 T9SS type A sorting domain-containing protein [Chitinophagales bacterium]